MSEQNPAKQRSPSRLQRFKQASVFTQTGVVLGGLGGVFILVLLAAVLVGLLTGNSEDVAAVVSIIRDLFIILLAMQGMLVCLSLAVIFLQVAALVNFLHNGTRPILQDLKKSSQTVRGTGEFLSENVVAPVIESRAWLAGAAAFLRELRGLFQR